MHPLPLLGAMALYAQWRFASPFLPNPALEGNSFAKRETPLILFMMAGILVSISFSNFTYGWFLASLFAGLAMICLAFALACRNRRP